ncbi:hypothetical protein TNCV_4576701 [Trichonephila clavipes]|nr:hypothetical protein TNCV_4576701 [Trichonephila clavipes]
MNTQDPYTPLGRGRLISSRWIRKKMSGLLRSGVLFLDDKARPYSVMAMKNRFASHGWKSLHQTTYRLDLASSDFNLFPDSKKISPEGALEVTLKINKPLNAFFVYKALSFPWRAF